MKAYDTVTEAMTDLAKRGYSDVFELYENCLICHENGIQLNANDYKIDELYRFEGNTDPSDETIVYAISSTNGTIKGTVVNAYGIYSDINAEELVSQLTITRK